MVIGIQGRGSLCREARHVRWFSADHGSGSNRSPFIFGSYAAPAAAVYRPFAGRYAQRVICTAMQAQQSPQHTANKTLAAFFLVFPANDAGGMANNGLPVQDRYLQSAFQPKGRGRGTASSGYPALREMQPNSTARHKANCTVRSHPGRREIPQQRPQCPTTQPDYPGKPPHAIKPHRRPCHPHQCTATSAAPPIPRPNHPEPAPQLPVATKRQKHPGSQAKQASPSLLPQKAEARAAPRLTGSRHGARVDPLRPLRQTPAHAQPCRHRGWSHRLPAAAAGPAHRPPSSPHRRRPAPPASGTAPQRPPLGRRVSHLPKVCPLRGSVLIFGGGGFGLPRRRAAQRRREHKARWTPQPTQNKS